MVDCNNSQMNNFKEEGYTFIPNDFLDALISSKLSTTQLRICLYLIICTYGQGEKTTDIALNDLAAACKSSKSRISLQVQELVDRDIVIQIETITGQAPLYKINPEFRG